MTHHLQFVISAFTQGVCLTIHRSRRAS